MQLKPPYFHFLSILSALLLLAIITCRPSLAENRALLIGVGSYDQIETGYWLDGSEEWEARFGQVAERMTAIWERGEAEGRDLEEIMDEYDEALERAGL